MAAGQSGAVLATSRRCLGRERPAASLTGNCSSGLPAAVTRRLKRRSRCWCGGTGRWCSGCAATCCEIRRTPKTRSRPLSWCSSGGALDSPARVGRRLAQWRGVPGCRPRTGRGGAARTVEQHAGLRIVAAADPSEGDESGVIVQEEVRRLPAKYRDVVVLCYWEGLTQEQAAAQLGCPLGTVRSRLARARDLLHRRLTRRGLAPLAAVTAAGARSRGADRRAPLRWDCVSLQSHRNWFIRRSGPPFKPPPVRRRRRWQPGWSLRW